MPVLNIPAYNGGGACFNGAVPEYFKSYAPSIYLSVGYGGNADKYWCRGAYSFSLADLPSTKLITITRVRLRVNCTSAGGAAGVWYIRSYNGDGQAYPCDDDAQTMAARCSTGTILVETTDYRNVGQYWHTLGDGATAQACIDVTNAKEAVNRYSVGFHENGDNDNWCTLDRVNSAFDLLEITYEYRFNQGHFKWYDEGWKTQDAELTNVENGDALRFRVCIHELLAEARSNLDINVEFREDGGDWQTLGGQGAIDKAWRWRDDVELTDLAVIDQARLSCTTENGLIHENSCTDCESIGANAHHEIGIILEPYSAMAGKTYEFRVVVEGKALRKDVEVSTLVKCTMYSPPAVGYQYGDGLVSIQVDG